MLRRHLGSLLALALQEHLKTSLWRPTHLLKMPEFHWIDLQHLGCRSYWLPSQSDVDYCKAPRLCPNVFWTRLQIYWGAFDTVSQRDIACIANYTNDRFQPFPRTSLLRIIFQGHTLEEMGRLYGRLMITKVLRDLPWWHCTGLSWSVRKRPREPMHMFTSSDFYWREVQEPSDYSHASHVYGFPSKLGAPRGLGNEISPSQLAGRPTSFITLTKLPHATSNNLSSDSSFEYKSW